VSSRKARGKEENMKFRPCIDIHNGKIKQIVGGSLSDQENQAIDNYIANQDGAYYANIYKQDGLTGGHIILLNSKESEYYEDTKAQAILALQAYPGGLQIGGGITDINAEYYLEQGASHVIVTSFVFKDGQINYSNLENILSTVGRKHLVLDLSCRKKNNAYYIVTNRWQQFTDVPVSYALLDNLSEYCDEFLIHAVDVEGKVSGIEEELVSYLGKWSGIPITYAGGVSDFEDLRKISELGNNRLDVTIGSALDLFGGKLKYQEVLKYIERDRIKTI